MKTVTIKTRKPEKDQFALSMGTEIFIGKQKIDGIKSINVKLRVDEPVIAEMEIMSFLEDVEGAIPRWYIGHPITGKPVEIKSVTLTDGTEVEYWEGKISSNKR